MEWGPVNIMKGRGIRGVLELVEEGSLQRVFFSFLWSETGQRIFPKFPDNNGARTRGN